MTLHAQVEAFIAEERVKLAALELETDALVSRLWTVREAHVTARQLGAPLALGDPVTYLQRHRDTQRALKLRLGEQPRGPYGFGYNPRATVKTP